MSENKGRDQADRGGENKADDSKTELANRIAKQSKKVANTYQHIEDGFVRAIRGFSSFTDKVLFNRKYGKLVALVLAVLMYVIVNFNSNSASLTTPLQNSKDKNNVTVTAKYNTDTFELSGLPATANITISGDASNVTSAANSKGYIVANLEGMTEGQHAGHPQSPRPGRRRHRHFPGP